MGYIESNLLPGEQVVYKAHLHRIIFVKSLLVIAVGLLLLALEPRVGGVVILVGLILALPAFIRYKTSEFRITTKRVVIKVGFIQRRTVELLLRQIEAISVDQSLMGRMMSFGTITISGTGGVREVFTDVAAPLDFSHQIQSQTA
ncbi:MAG: MFS transporter permease [Candidatus Rokuibacteriota bacterium]|nr:MAG: MFS transporter permease [Candidatus Rokubacteria bacterium]